MSLVRYMQLWFGMREAVSQLTYVVSGVMLMLFKYTVEAATIQYYTGRFYTPQDFVHPLLSAREQFTTTAPEWLGMAWVVWTLPFVWIAVSMSVRRALDARLSPWIGMAILVPLLNYFTMFCLAIVGSTSSRNEDEQSEQPEDAQFHDIWHSPTTQELPVTAVTDNLQKHSGLKAVCGGVVVGVVYALSLTLLSVYFFNSYGAALFFGTPLVTGTVTAYLYNQQCSKRLSATLGLATLVVVFFSGLLLFFALEGMICIIMALPIVVPVALLGAGIGYLIANATRNGQRDETRGALWCLAFLPFLAGAETLVQPAPTFEVMTSVEIDAPPERVWQCVIDFPDITELPEWYFRAGIASPERARIEGSGVGATRYCEFSTGSFVEPITVWDEPHRLAFDVSEQPEPMFELTPYRHIHPPHLKGSFRSTRGEFLLIPLPDGGTRLEGRTWYQVDFYPHAYWTVWTDSLVHRIHKRVLRHIQTLAEE